MSFSAKIVCDINFNTIIIVGNNDTGKIYSSLEDLVKKELGYSLLISRYFFIKHKDNYTKDMLFNFLDKSVFGIHFKISEDYPDPINLKKEIYELLENTIT